MGIFQRLLSFSDHHKWGGITPSFVHNCIEPIEMMVIRDCELKHPEQMAATPSTNWNTFTEPGGKSEFQWIPVIQNSIWRTDGSNWLHRMISHRCIIGQYHSMMMTYIIATPTDHITFTSKSADDNTLSDTMAIHYQLYQGAVIWKHFLSHNHLSRNNHPNVKTVIMRTIEFIDQMTRSKLIGRWSARYSSRGNLWLSTCDITPVCKDGVSYPQWTPQIRTRVWCGPPIPLWI